MVTWQEIERGTGECRGGGIAVTRFRWRVCCGPSPAVQRFIDKPKEITEAAKQYEERRDVCRECSSISTNQIHSSIQTSYSIQRI